MKRREAGIAHDRPLSEAAQDPAPEPEPDEQFPGLRIAGAPD